MTVSSQGISAWHEKIWVTVAQNKTFLSASHAMVLLDSSQCFQSRKQRGSRDGIIGLYATLIQIEMTPQMFQGWISMSFQTGILAPLMMNRAHFADAFTFSWSALVKYLNAYLHS